MRILLICCFMFFTFICLHHCSPSPGPQETPQEETITNDSTQKDASSEKTVTPDVIVQEVSQEASPEVAPEVAKDQPSAQAPSTAWVVHPVGKDTNDTGVILDGQGNAYIIGTYFADTTTFGSISLTTEPKTVRQFVAKLDSEGKWLWAISIPGAVGEESDIAIDSKGNLCVTGIFEKTATFDSITLTAKGSKDIYVATGWSG